MLDILCLALFPACAPVAAQEPLGLLERRAREAAAVICAEPSWAEDLFDRSFLKAVPPERIRAIGRDYHEKCGELLLVQATQRKGPFAGTFDLILEKERVVPMTITLSEKPPHSVVGLLFGLPAPLLTSQAALVLELEKLPGKLSFALWELGGEEPVVLAELAPDEPLAIGSIFKLYVLGALVQDVLEERRAGSDVIALEVRHRSLPSGQLHTWPVGTPVTLATLATLMISISDNTATDHLLFALGRERVEELLEPMGNRHAALSRPFLATHELFRLKLTAGGARAERYLALEPEKRRAWLDEELASVPLDPDTIDHGGFSSPNRIESLEWFASAADVCRALDWLRRRTEAGPAAPLRELLAANRGLDVSRELFPWCGFKGGSEPGVLGLCFLLRDAAERWYAVAVLWNDPAQAVDEQRLYGLVQRALYVLGTKERER